MHVFQGLLRPSAGVLLRRGFSGDHLHMQLYTVLASNQPMLTVNAHDPEEAREALSVLRWTI